MTLDESLSWLNSTQFFGIKLGLENTSRLLARLGNPERHLRILHIAGTNGKGSVCAMSDSILRSAGLKTGLFTSPHLCDYRERVRVDGTMISREATAQILTQLHSLCQDWPHSPTFFELSTALALAHFAREQCEVVILETGMGGRLDATNAVTPLASIITPIAMDHAEWLGDSITRIATEKAGIIKPGIPVVSSPQSPDATQVLREHAARASSRLTFVDSPYSGPLGLSGAHQKWNASLALLGLQAADLLPADHSIVNGLKNVSWPARFQRVGDRIIVDGAHNPHAVSSLVETWREEFGSQKPTVIFGALKDKDHREMLALLSSLAHSFLFVPIASPRSRDPAEFPPDTTRPSKIAPTLPSAIQSALAIQTPVLITGSLFLAGEALAALHTETFPNFHPTEP